MSTIIVVDNDLDTLLTALYVFLDDHVIGPRRVGRPPWLTDAELLATHLGSRGSAASPSTGVQP